jgi:hypothetical protein
MSLKEEVIVKRINGNVILFMNPLLGLKSGSPSAKPRMKAIRKAGATRVGMPPLQPITMAK